MMKSNTCSKDWDSVEPPSLPLHLHTFFRTTKFTGETKGGVSDIAANPPMQFIPFLKASFLRCGNHTSLPSSSMSFVNFPDLFSPA